MQATLGREPTVSDMGGSYQIVRAANVCLSFVQRSWRTSQLKVCHFQAQEVREKFAQDIYGTGKSRKNQK